MPPKKQPPPPKNPSTPKNPTTPRNLNTLNNTGTPKPPDAPKTPITPKNPNTPKNSNAPQNTDSPKPPNTPRNTNTPKPPNTPKTHKTPAAPSFMAATASSRARNRDKDMALAAVAAEQEQDQKQTKGEIEVPEEAVTAATAVRPPVDAVLPVPLPTTPPIPSSSPALPALTSPPPPPPRPKSRLQNQASQATAAAAAAAASDPLKSPTGSLSSRDGSFHSGDGSWRGSGREKKPWDMHWGTKPAAPGSSSPAAASVADEYDATFGSNSSSASSLFDNSRRSSRKSQGEGGGSGGGGGGGDAGPADVRRRGTLGEELARRNISMRSGSWSFERKSSRKSRGGGDGVSLRDRRQQGTVKEAMAESEKKRKREALGKGLSVDILRGGAEEEEEEEEEGSDLSVEQEGDRFMEGLDSKTPGRNARAAFVPSRLKERSDTPKSLDHHEPLPKSAPLGPSSLARTTSFGINTTANPDDEALRNALEALKKDLEAARDSTQASLSTTPGAEAPAIPTNENDPPQVQNLRHLTNTILTLFLASNIQLQDRHETLKATLSSTQSDLHASKAETSQLQDANQTLKATLSRTQSDLQASKARAERLQTTLDSERKSHMAFVDQQAKAARVDMDLKLALANRRAERLQASRDGDVTALQASLEEQTGLHGAARTALDAERKALDGLRQDHSAALAMLDSHRTDLASKAQALETSQAELKDAKAELSELRTSHTAALESALEAQASEHASAVEELPLLRRMLAERATSTAADAPDLSEALSTWKTRAREAEAQLAGQTARFLALQHTAAAHYDPELERRERDLRARLTAAQDEKAVLEEELRDAREEGSAWKEDAGKAREQMEAEREEADGLAQSQHDEMVGYVREYFSRLPTNDPEWYRVEPLQACVRAMERELETERAFLGRVKEERETAYRKIEGMIQENDELKRALEEKTLAQTKDGVIVTMPRYMTREGKEEIEAQMGAWREKVKREAEQQREKDRILERVRQWKMDKRYPPLKKGWEKVVDESSWTRWDGKGWLHFAGDEEKETAMRLQKQRILV
ncbi:hypothetical protein BS50DRAFT_582516 [Corynespora cassiicola Philippines]|uniref:Uncharacterized protein n=1 Tax=Corynespora cassiicola Philippines TaxID=1448308 RepID=A0A2T2P5N7_CORCC|nr:hypothetical protein BS50DRAFT_582516 [Corynespora cassiicola Philippines]